MNRPSALLAVLALLAARVSGQELPLSLMIAIDNSGSVCVPTLGGTDTADKRIAAMHDFVDSLAARSQQSRLGVLIFRHTCAPDGEVLSPTPVGIPDSVQDIHLKISEARCKTSDPYFGKALAQADTYQGCAVLSAMLA